MKSRHKAREIALQILYQFDLLNYASGQPLPQPQALIQSLSQYFEHFKVAPELRPFIGQLVSGSLLEIAKIDPILEKHTANWKIARMSSVDRSLLRMATYEMLFLKEVAPSIVIDEAIELAKGFGTAETPAFINGVLDAVRSESPSQEPQGGEEPDASE